MTLTKPILIFTLLSSLLFSCAEDKKAHNYLKNQNLGTAYHSIVVLTEKGCPTCNSSLANTITSLQYDSTLIVVSALGTIIDLTDIQQNQLNNTLVYDYQEQFKELGLFDSGVILLNNQLEIDSIFKIEAQQLPQQLAFIKRLSKGN